MQNKYFIGFCTNDREEECVTISKTLVTEKLAACVNIMPNLRSIYSWQSKICDEKEFLMIIKTSEKHLKNIQKRITELHHYEVPEIIFIPIETGLPEYLNWINQNTDRNA